MLTDVADQHDLGVGRDVLLEDWALLLPTKGLVVPGTIQGLGRRQVTQVKPALGTHCHHQVLGEMRQGRGLVVIPEAPTGFRQCHPTVMTTDHRPS